MSFDVSDIVVDIHDINDLDNKNRRRRSGGITTINSIFLNRFHNAWAFNVFIFIH